MQLPFLQQLVEDEGSSIPSSEDLSTHRTGLFRVGASNASCRPSPSRSVRRQHIVCAAHAPHSCSTETEKEILGWGTSSRAVNPCEWVEPFLFAPDHQYLRQSN